MVRLNEYTMEELENMLIRTNQECSEVLPLKRIPTTDEINILFRAFHSLKSNVLYMDLDEIADWAVMVEETLSKLKNGLEYSNEIINWLNNLLEQINIWSVQVQAGDQRLEFINIFKKEPDWLNQDTESIYEMSILFVGVNLNIQKILAYKFNRFTSLHDKEKIKIFIEAGADIVIIDHSAGKDLIEYTEDLIDTTTTATLAISHQPTEMFTIIPKALIFNPKKERMGNIYNYIINAVHSNPNIMKRFSRKQNLKAKYIEYLVSNIAVMPDAVNKIRTIIKHPHFEMLDLIEAVRKDPIASALILKAGYDPKYGIGNDDLKLPNIITLLGPKMVYTILAEKVLSKSFKHDLTPYGISINHFLLLSIRRAIAVDKWVKHNNYRHLEDASMMVYFAALGQYILSEDLMFIGKDGIFTNLIEDNSVQILQAEKQIAGYTTPQLSAVILENWGFEHEMFFPLMKMGGFEHGVRDAGMKQSIAILNYVFDVIDQVGENDLNNSLVDHEEVFYNLGLDLESLSKLLS